jgi:predicted dehydrogenase
MHRRRFLVTSVAATSLAALPRWARSSGTGAPKLRTALVGCGWWGNNILREAMASGACSVVGLCDVDTRRFEPTLAHVREGTGEVPRTFVDYRDLLNDTKPEIVIVATPDHWHALPTIASVQAGAHVFVEKPIGHSIHEGRAMVNAARATGCVVQVGTHRRISPHNLSARSFIQSGRLGDIGMVRCFVHYAGGPERPRPNAPVPSGLDWDRWCGPAPLRPYNEIIHPRGFRNFLDFANGTLGDWGIHWLDQVLWITGEKYPTHVYSTGGRPIAGPAILSETEQTTDAPDHQLATYTFDRFSVQWEHRRFAGNGTDKGEPVGCYFYGTRGILHLGWQSGWTFYPADPKEQIVREPAQLNEPDHQNIRELWADFLAAIRTGRRPVCDIGEIHLSTNLALLGMLSYKRGKSIAWDGQQERVVGDEAANRLLRREYRAGYEHPGI